MTRILAVLNLTPDSFSDGGSFASMDRVVEQVDAWLEAGVDWIDVGAESTRPGAKPVLPAEELERLSRYLPTLCRRFGSNFFSVDTRHETTAASCYSWGIRFFNNVAGIFQESTLKLISPGSRYIAMHLHGTPETMQVDPLQGPTGEEVVHQGLASFERQLGPYLFDEVFLDPGIGFGKEDRLNWRLLRNAFGKVNWCIGISRKGFLGRWLSIDNPLKRDEVTKGIEGALMMSGVGLLRTHDPLPLLRLRRMIHG